MQKTMVMAAESMCVDQDEAKIVRKMELLIVTEAHSVTSDIWVGMCQSPLAFFVLFDPIYHHTLRCIDGDPKLLNKTQSSNGTHITWCLSHFPKFSIMHKSQPNAKQTLENPLN